MRKGYESLSSEQRVIVDAITDPLQRRLTIKGLLEQHKFKAEPLFKLTGHGHYESHFVEELKEIKESLKSKPTVP